LLLCILSICKESMGRPSMGFNTLPGRRVDEVLA